MLNASGFNSATYNGRAVGARVLLASAVMAAGVAAEAEPLRIAAGAADQQGVTHIVEPRAIANYAGRMTGYPQAIFEPSRPWDLMTAGWEGNAYLEPSDWVLRGGLADLDVQALLSAQDVVHRFFSFLEAESAVDPVPSRVDRPARADMLVTAEFGGEPRNWHQGEVDTVITASIDPIESTIYAGPRTEFSLLVDLFAEAHVNDVQPGWSDMAVTTSMEVDEFRLAGGRVEATVHAAFQLRTIPGRAVSLEEGHVRATLEAVWFAFVHEFADMTGQTSMEATAHQVHASEADMQATASGEPTWSRIVEPRKVWSLADATLTADGWNITPAAADMRVRSWAEEDGRVALRGITDAAVLATLRAKPSRIIFSELELQGVGSVIRSRPSVNITNPAPPERYMVVPEADRVMVVPEDNRVMVVS